jgi:Zn-dependent protease
MMSADAEPKPARDSNVTEYYRLNSRKLTYREYWNMAGSWQVIIPWTAKLLNVPMNFLSGLPFFESVRELEIAESDFPAEAREKLQPLLDQSRQIGFDVPRFYTYESMRRESRTSFIALLHPSGATLRLMYTVAMNVHPPKGKLLAVLLSELSDGTFFLTTHQKPQLLSAPGILTNRVLGADPARLVESHLQKLGEFKSSNPALQIESVEALDALWDRYEKSSREFGVKRGLYVRMSPEEVAAERKRMEEVKTMAGSGTENMEVLQELNKLQTKKAGWGNAVTLLIVSLALFVGAGARQWTWKYVLILVPVLLVHELGHYLAMRAFNYHNLRMFFIPFFGAAVSGQHYNVPGWKKVIVSQMGPVPGIILGVIIGGAGLLLHHALLTKVAIVTLILNGFNLLPVLPFDGGWVFHTLLFSRHYLLDTTFRVLAALALMVGGSLSHNKILMYLGIPMLISIPLTHRIARIATTLRARGISPTPADDQTIPAETAQAIIEEVKRSTQKPESNKLLAQHTLQIFETLNARPPGWPATIGLLFAHVSSLGMAVVFGLVFMLGQRGTFQNLLTRLADHEPKHKLECGALRSWGEQRLLESSNGPGNTIIATFPKPGAAAQMFQDLTNSLPATTTLRLFGDSLLFALPTDQEASRREWLGKFQRQTTNVLVESTNCRAIFSLSCLAPSKEMAETITNELNGYWGTLRDVSLVPPWLPQDNRSAEARARHQLARQTYIQLEEAQFQGYGGTESELIALQKKVASARRQGEQAEADALRQQIRDLMETAAKKNVERVRNGERGEVDTRVVDWFIARSASASRTNEPDEKATLEMAQRMGQLPLVNGHASPNDERYSTHGGLATRKDLRLHLEWVTFNRVSDGAPALVEWLCDKGCVDFKYELTTSLGSEDQDAD